MLEQIGGAGWEEDLAAIDLQKSKCVPWKELSAALVLETGISGHRDAEGTAPCPCGGERVEPGAGMLCEPPTLHFKAILLIARATCLGDALHPAQSHE